MRRHCYPIRLILLVGLLLAITQLALAQSRAIRPVIIQIPDGEQVELYKGSYALVIGASDYQDNAWSDLSSVREDVKAVREALEEQGFQVDTLLDPTEDALINEINDFQCNHSSSIVESLVEVVVSCLNPVLSLTKPVKPHSAAVFPIKD